MDLSFFFSFPFCFLPCPRDSQESIPGQLKNISSLALSLLYGPTLTSVHNNWKKHSLPIQTFVTDLDASKGIRKKYSGNSH